MRKLLSCEQNFWDFLRTKENIQKFKKKYFIVYGAKLTKIVSFPVIRLELVMGS